MTYGRAFEPEEDIVLPGRPAGLKQAVALLFALLRCLVFLGRRPAARIKRPVIMNGHGRGMV